MTNLLFFLTETEETTQLSGTGLVIYDIFVYSLTVFLIVLTILSITRRNKKDVSFSRCATTLNIELNKLQEKIQNKTKKNRIKYNFSKLYVNITSLNAILMDLQTKSNLIEVSEAITLSSQAEKKISRFILNNTFKSQDDRNKYIVDLYQNLRELSGKLDYIYTYID